MATKVEVLRKRQIAQSLAEKTGLKLKNATAILDFVFNEIASSVAKGVKVNIKDFGIFTKAQRSARTGRNPATGETIKIKASVKPRFSASKALKEAVVSKKYPAMTNADALAINSEGVESVSKNTPKKTVDKKEKAPKKAAAPKKVAKKK